MTASTGTRETMFGWILFAYCAGAGGKDGDRSDMVCLIMRTGNRKRVPLDSTGQKTEERDVRDIRNSCCETPLETEESGRDGSTFSAPGTVAEEISSSGFYGKMNRERWTPQGKNIWRLILLDPFR